MIIGGNFGKLWNSDYLEYDKEKDEYYLLDGAPPEIVESFEIYKEIEAEEKRTGKHIF